MSRAQPASDYITRNTAVSSQIRSGTNLEAEVTIASAATTDIGAAAANRVAISGVVTITSLGSAVNAVRLVRFTGALILTHNATSLVLPGAASITTAAGDTAIFSSDGSGNWRCLSYTKVSGQATVSPTLGSLATATIYTSADQTWTAGVTTTVSHGLGLLPKFWQATIRCKTAEFGYAIGDEISVNFGGGDGTSLHSAGVSSTQFWLVVYTQGLHIINKSTPASLIAATPANWALVFRAIAI